jgi:hypothetical protein
MRCAPVAPLPFAFRKKAASVPNPISMLPMSFQRKANANDEAVAGRLGPTAFYGSDGCTCGRNRSYMAGAFTARARRIDNSPM